MNRIGVQVEVFLLVSGILAAGLGVCTVFDFGGFMARKANSVHERQRAIFLMNDDLSRTETSAPNTIRLRVYGIMLIFMGLLMVLIGMADRA